MTVSEDIFTAVQTVKMAEKVANKTFIFNAPLHFHHTAMIKWKRESLKSLGCCLSVKFN